MCSTTKSMGSFSTSRTLGDKIHESFRNKGKRTDFFKSIKLKYNPQFPLRFQVTRNIIFPKKLYKLQNFTYFTLRISFIHELSFLFIFFSVHQFLIILFHPFNLLKLRIFSISFNISLYL